MNDTELGRQLEAAEQGMDQYRHALRALATGQTVEQAREEIAREEGEGAEKGC